MREETIDGAVYRVGKMNAKAQWNVARRLAPVLAAAGPMFKMWVNNAAVDINAGKELDVDEIFDVAGPLAIALGEMSDEASDYVIGRCLSVCTVQRGPSWAAVATAHGDLMFDTISMATMMRLVLCVLQENLLDFFPAQAGSLNGPPAI